MISVLHYDSIRVHNLVSGLRGIIETLTLGSVIDSPLEAAYYGVLSATM
jgi:hypothetical protein